MPHYDSILQLTNELGSGRLTRRQFVARGLALGLSLSALGTLLAACDDSDGGQPAAAASPTPLDQTMPAEISVYNWAEYLAPSVRKGFETEYGIEVKESYFDNNEAMLSKLKAGATGWDVLVPSSYMASVLIKSGLVQPLHYDYLPNMQHTLPTFVDPVYDPGTDGLRYTVPYMWGTTGYAVRTDKLSDPITRWADLWDQKYRGQISMMSDERECLAAGLKVLGHSLNSTDPDEIAAAGQKLAEQKPLVQKYVITNSYREIVQGAAPITHCWNGEIALAYGSLGEGSETMMRYVLPEEGFTVWSDTLAIPVGAKSPYGAHLFMDYLLRPEVAEENALWIGYLPTSESALETVRAESPVADMIIPGEADLERGEIMNDVGEAASLYSSAWREVVAE